MLADQLDMLFLHVLELRLPLLVKEVDLALELGEGSAVLDAEVVDVAAHPAHRHLSLH